MHKLLVLALHSQTLARCLMGPLALGAVLGAAAATPEPTAPITESGAYLPITSGGWILQSQNACRLEQRKQCATLIAAKQHVELLRGILSSEGEDGQLATRVI